RLPHAGCRPRAPRRRGAHGDGPRCEPRWLDHAAIVDRGPSRVSRIARRKTGRRTPGAWGASVARVWRQARMKTDVVSALPLEGRVVVITRAEGQAGRFATLLEQAGARVIVAPTIVIAPPDSWTPVDAALARSTDYRWVIFTSVNGVEMVRQRLEQAGRGRETLSACRIAAIGPATAEALRAWGLPPEVV